MHLTLARNTKREGERRLLCGRTEKAAQSENMGSEPPSSAHSGRGLPSGMYVVLKVSHSMRNTCVYSYFKCCKGNRMRSVQESERSESLQRVWVGSPARTKTLPTSQLYSRAISARLNAFRC